MTGWGQDGPYAHTAGHDINYIALAGALEPIGRRARRRCRRSTSSATSAAAACCSPSAWCAALLEAKTLGQGPGRRRRDGRRRRRPDDDVPRVPGHGHLGGRAGHQPARHRRPLLRRVRDQRRQVRLDRLDRAAVLRRAAPPHGPRQGDPDLPWQNDKAQWPALKERLAAIFKTKTRDEWCAIMEGTDVCFAPVLSMGEAPQHPHNVAARHLPRARRHRAARACAAVQPHARRGRSAARPRRPAHRRGARRVARRRQPTSPSSATPEATSRLFGADFGFPEDHRQTIRGGLQACGYRRFGG